MADAIKDSVRRLYAALTDVDEDAIRALMAPDVVDHNPDPGQGPGVDGVIAAFREMRAAFPDMTVEVLRVIAEGDLAASHARFAGTHRGDFAGMPATGKRVEVEVVDMTRWVDGRMAERWGVFDAAGMLAQLGVLPG